MGDVGVMRSLTYFNNEKEAEYGIALKERKLRGMSKRKNGSKAEGNTKKGLESHTFSGK